MADRQDQLFGQVEVEVCVCIVKQSPKSSSFKMSKRMTVQQWNFKDIRGFGEKKVTVLNFTF